MGMLPPKQRPWVNRFPPPQVTKSRLILPEELNIAVHVLLIQNFIVA